MQFKTKLTLGTALVAIVPAALTAAIIGMLALDQAGRGVDALVADKLVAVRAAQRQAIERYFATVTDHLRTLAVDTMTIEALGEFHAALAIAPGAAEMPPPATQRAVVRDYYGGPFSDAWRARHGQAPATTAFDALDTAAIAAQYTYIATNPAALGHKQDYAGPGRDAYDHVHARFHAALREVQQRFGYYDVFLVDSDGRVVYTVFKETDFATSLVDGPYRDSGLGAAFRASRDLAPGDTAVIDFAPYAPSYDTPAAFLATPVFDGARRLGALVVQLPIERIQDIMNFGGAWTRVGLGASGETFLLGEDGRLRSDPRAFVEDRDGYRARLQRDGATTERTPDPARHASTIGSRPPASAALTGLLGAEPGRGRYTDDRGQVRLVAHTPLAIPGLAWHLVAAIDENEARGRLAALSRDLRMDTLLIVIATMVLGCAAGWLAARLLVRPLMRTLDETGAISAGIASGKGDFTARVSTTTNDEFSRLGEGINGLLQAAQGFLHELATTVSDLQRAAADVDGNTRRLHASATAQVTEATQVATAMDQMTSSIDEVARNAVIAAERTRTVDDSAREGTRLVEDSKRMFEQLVADFDGTVESVTRLEGACQEIGTVLGVIQGIAEQTNLLALNAAIEAARAGEQGRGFAVVADEVRTLAGRTQQSTLQIERIIDQLQSQARNATVRARGGQQVLGDGIARAAQVGDALESIAASIETLEGMNAQVATTAEEQSAVCNEVNSNVQRITHAAEQLNEVVGASQEASARLKTLGERLEGVIGRVSV